MWLLILLSFPLSRAWHWHYWPVTFLGPRCILPTSSWVIVFHDFMHIYKQPSTGHQKSSWSTPNSISNWVPESSHNWEIQLNTWCLYCSGKKEERRVLWMEIFLLDRHSNLIEMVIGWVIPDSSSMNGKFSNANEVSSLCSQVWDMSQMIGCLLRNQDCNSWVLE